MNPITTPEPETDLRTWPRALAIPEHRKTRSRHEGIPLIWGLGFGVKGSGFGGDDLRRRGAGRGGCPCRWGLEFEVSILTCGVSGVGFWRTGYEPRGGDVPVNGTAYERRRDSLKGFEGIHLKATSLTAICMPNATAVAPKTLDPTSHTPHLTRTGEGNHALNPKPYTLYPTPYTQHPTPHTCRERRMGNGQPRNPPRSTARSGHTPYTLHPAPCTLHPTPYTPHPGPHTPHLYLTKRVYQLVLESRPPH